jgi:hypothetical protein
LTATILLAANDPMRLRKTSDLTDNLGQLPRQEGKWHHAVPPFAAEERKLAFNPIGTFCWTLIWTAFLGQIGIVLWIL